MDGPNIQEKNHDRCYVIEFECDPVIRHCIELRKYQRKVERLILLSSPLKKVKRKSRRDAILRSLSRIPVLPELPEEEYIRNYRNKKEDVRMVPYTQNHLRAVLSKVIAAIFYLYGFSECPENLLHYMTCALEDYIKSFIHLMKKNTPPGEFLSVDSLEAAMTYIGLSGIGVLHDYYTQNVIRFHDHLFKACRQLKNELESNLEKS